VGTPWHTLGGLPRSRLTKVQSSLARAGLRTHCRRPWPSCAEDGVDVAGARGATSRHQKGHLGADRHHFQWDAITGHVVVEVEEG
jgi:hypothetical protein